MAQYTSGFSGILTKKEYASEQSANALFTCMKDIQFLKDILKRKKSILDITKKILNI